MTPAGHITMTAIPKPKRSTTKATKAKCVVLSGKIVVHRGICFCCGKSQIGKCDPHHIVPRSHNRTVARVDNQVPLCRPCHSYAHNNPDAFRYIIDSIFPGRRLMLEAVARVNEKVDWNAVYEGLVSDAKIKGIM